MNHPPVSLPVTSGGSRIPGIAGNRVAPSAAPCAPAFCAESVADAPIVYARRNCLMTPAHAGASSSPPPVYCSAPRAERIEQAWCSYDRDLPRNNHLSRVIRMAVKRNFRGQARKVSLARHRLRGPTAAELLSRVDTRAMARTRCHAAHSHTAGRNSDVYSAPKVLSFATTLV